MGYLYFYIKYYFYNEYYVWVFISVMNYLAANMAGEVDERYIYSFYFI